MSVMSSSSLAAQGLKQTTMETSPFVLPAFAQTSSLLNAIPQEIRLEIYALLLITPSGLRSKRISDECRETAILRTCQQMHHEALPVLYTKYTFHIPSLKTSSLDEIPFYTGFTTISSLPFKTHLGSMRHLILDAVWSEQLDGQSEDDLAEDDLAEDETQIQDMETALVKYITHISEQCVGLSTLMLQVAAPGTIIATDRSRLPQLASLIAHLGKFTLICFNTFDISAEMRSGIAPDATWSTYRLDDSYSNPSERAEIHRRTVWDTIPIAEVQITRLGDRRLALARTFNAGRASLAGLALEGGVREWKAVICHLLGEAESTQQQQYAQIPWVHVKKTLDTVFP